MLEPQPLDQAAFPGRLAGVRLAQGGHSLGLRSGALSALPEKPVQRFLPSGPLRRQPAPERVGDEPARALHAHMSPVAQAIIQVTLDCLRVRLAGSAVQLELIEHFPPIREDDLGRSTVGSGRGCSRKIILHDFVFAGFSSQCKHKALHKALPPSPLAQKIPSTPDLTVSDRLNNLPQINGFVF